MCLQHYEIGSLSNYIDIDTKGIELYLLWELDNIIIGEGSKYVKTCCMQYELTIDILIKTPFRYILKTEQPLSRFPLCTYSKQSNLCQGFR